MRRRTRLAVGSTSASLPRRCVGRARVPLHRRLLHQRAALGHWAVVAALALATAATVHRLLDQAAQAQARWGRTREVVVAERPIPAGQPLEGNVRLTRQPIAVVPRGALGEVTGGARAAQPIGVGEVVTAARVTTRLGGGSVGASRGPPGRRTIALPAGRAPLPVRAGDRVDVWATVDPALAGRGAGPTTLVAAGAIVVTAQRDLVTVSVDRAEARAVATAAALGTVTLAGTPD